MATAELYTGKDSGKKIIDPQTMEVARAIKDYAQVLSICKQMVSDNDDRDKNNAKIQEALNDTPPYDPKELAAHKQNWRNNRSTGFLSTIIKRVLPAYKHPFDNSKTLTLSRVPSGSKDADRKSDIFRTEITTTIRQWRKWSGLIHKTLHEDISFGYAAWVWVDEFDWKPMMCRVDEILFPDACPDEPQDVPLFMLKQNYRIHELASKLSDPEASEMMGWNVKHLIEAINESKPDSRDTKTTGELRQFQDIVRENTVGSSYSQGVKVIQAYHMFVQEVSGRVSHYIVTEKGKGIYMRLDKYESMADCLTLFSIEVGNGKIHGSKGAGRILHKTHVAIEKARNLAADNLYLSGLLVLRGSQSGKQKAAITVTNPIVVVDQNYEVSDVKLGANPEAYAALDRQMTQIAEMQVGAFLPGQILDQKGRRRTATEVGYVAKVEEQIREGHITRCWLQGQAGIFNMQKKICSPENLIEAERIFKQEQMSSVHRISRKMYDFMVRIGRIIVGQNEPPVQEDNKANKEAVDCCLNMLRHGLSVEEIYEAANNSSIDLTTNQVQNLQLISQLSQQYKGDPNIRQVQLKRAHIQANLGYEMADSLVIPEEDPTEVSEATSKQIMEIPQLLSGEKMPVSPRDNHRVHLSVMSQKATQIVKQMAGIKPEMITPQMIKGAETALAHFNEHIQAEVKNGGSPQSLAKEMQESKMAGIALSQAKAAIQNAKAAHPIPSGQGNAGSIPPNIHLVPPPQ